MADDVVRQEADGTPGEAGQICPRLAVLRVRKAVARHLFFDCDQGVVALRGIIVRPAMVDAIWLGADEAVPGQTLAALHRLEQERVVPPCDLEECGHRCLQIGRHVPIDRHEVIVGALRQREDFFEGRCVVHSPISTCSESRK
jgi:hypothetical protein